MAALASDQQSHPHRHVVYLAAQSDALAAELEAVDSWERYGAVIEDAAGDLLGWLVGEIDEEIGRVWWLGPFVAGGDWSGPATALYEHLRPSLPSAITQEEFAVDHFHQELIDWATELGFVRETGSALLRLNGRESFDAPAVRPIESRDLDLVASMHDDVFPGSHLTGRQLVEGGDGSRIRLVVEHGGVVVGYVAAERQPDGDGYIDLLGVDPAHRRHGHGAELVGGAVSVLRRLGCRSVHLTVRETNRAAIGLYAGLGFTKERVLVPLRKGFSYDD
jgi:ribosomal protein S18 acetylase RimI-like enzyme